jgi:hypothetical protein
MFETPAGNISSREFQKLKILLSDILMKNHTLTFLFRSKVPTVLYTEATKVTANEGATQDMES